MKLFQDHINQFVPLWQKMRTHTLDEVYTQEHKVIYLPTLGIALGLIGVAIGMLLNSASINLSIKVILIMLTFHFLEKYRHFTNLNLIHSFLQKQNTFGYSTQSNYKPIITVFFIIMQFLAIRSAFTTNNLWIILLIPSISYLSLANSYYLTNQHTQQDKINKFWIGLTIFFTLLKFTNCLIFLLVWFTQSSIYSRIKNKFSIKNTYEFVDTSVVTIIYFLILLTCN